jgi:LysR family glycine cleavage system transcriptional activator
MLRHLKQRGDSRVVTVTASQAIVAKWLLPRLDEFTARHGDIVIRLDVTDRLVDIAKGEADIGIRCGSGGWKDLDATHLSDEQIIVVCAPALLPASGSVNIGWLCQQTLLHDTTPASLSSFPSWSDWNAMFGPSPLEVDRGVRINASSAIIQATVSGQGVALARRSLVAEDIAAGRLVQIFSDREMPITWAYYAVASPEALTRPSVAAFRNWLSEAWRR